MPDDVIKNPNRKPEQSTTVRSSKYVPEWQRLGKEPMIYEANPSDAMFLGNNNKKRSQKVPPPAQPSKPAQVQQAPGQEHAFVQPPKTKRPVAEVQPPQQAKVSVGQNGNWFDAEEERQEPIPYEDVPDPPGQPAFEVSEEDEPEEAAPVEKAEDSEKLAPGEYGILVKDVLIAKTPSLSKAEGIIDKILFEQIEQFSDVTFDDVMLIRRLPLKVGVLAVDR